MFKKFAVIGLVLLNSGCSIFSKYDSYKDNWIPPKNIPPIEIVLLENAKEVNNTCKTLGLIPPFSRAVLGCVNYSKEKCVVYLEKDYDEYVWAHEMLHCSGWKHKRGDVAFTQQIPVVEMQQQ